MTRLPLRTIGDAPKATKDLLVAADVQCGHKMVERECANSWIAACANTVAAASADSPQIIGCEQSPWRYLLIAPSLP
jgi:hypothetical protein